VLEEGTPVTKFGNIFPLLAAVIKRLAVLSLTYHSDFAVTFPAKEITLDHNKLYYLVTEAHRCK